MKVLIRTDSGSKIIDLDIPSLSDDEVIFYARSGVMEARQELKSRIGYDPFKPLEEYTQEDAEFFSEWLKNNRPEEYDTIEESSSDGE